MPKFEVDVTITTVETWEVEAATEEEARLYYEDGELVIDPDVHKEISEVREVVTP